MERIKLLNDQTEVDTTHLQHNYAFIEFIKENNSGLSMAYDYMTSRCSYFSSKSKLDFYLFVYKNSSISENLTTSNVPVNTKCLTPTQITKKIS